MMRYNPKWEDLAQASLANFRYVNNNYYLNDDDMARYALEFLLAGLRANLRQCLNVTEDYCDIWYKDSHSGCKDLMDQIADILGEDIIQLQFNYNDPWD